MNYYIQRFKVFTSTVFLKVYDGDGILMEVVWRLEKMKSFSSGGLHVPCVAQSTVSTCVRCVGGEVLEPQSLMKPSLAPPVHVKKARKTGSHGDCDYAFLCYRDHSDPAPSFMARLLAVLA